MELKSKILAVVIETEAGDPIVVVGNKVGYLEWLGLLEWLNQQRYPAAATMPTRVDNELAAEVEEWIGEVTGEMGA